MVGKLWTILGMAAAMCLFSGTQASAAVEQVNIEIINGCDGYDLWVFGDLGILGFHTGCGGGALVLGNEFVTPNEEEGIRIYTFDAQTLRFLRVEFFLTGFRANNFYVYELFSSQLQYYGDWEFAP